MKVLQLCIKPPYPPVDGGTMAMNSVTQGLLNAGCEVRVLSVCSDKHPVRRQQMTDEYLERTRFESVYIDLKARPLDAFMALMCGESYHVKRFVSKDFEAKLIGILKAETFDVIHVESIFLTPYLPTMRRYSDAKVVLRAHNVEHHIWHRIARQTRQLAKRWYLKKLALALCLYEREHAAEYDGIACITPTDAEFFRTVTRRPIVDFPFGVDCPEPMDNVAIEPGTLFHIGSMDWMPNEESIRWFLCSVWPMLHRELPQVRLYLAGRKMPQDLMDIELEGVRVIGEVDDAQYFMASKQINIVPLLSGSGIRVKIIEAMSLGKTVVSTSIGAEGILCEDGRDILIADRPEDFVRQIRRCVEDPAFCKAIGDNAYRLILSEYDNTRLTERLMDFYRQLGAVEEGAEQ